MYLVQFLSEQGKLVEKRFDSLWACRKFVNKCKHSKRVRLVSYPLSLDY